MSTSEQKSVLVNNQLLPPDLPFGLNLQKHITDIQALSLRHDDVFICAYPKTGTHWLWEVCYMLLQGKVEYEKRSKEHLMLELMPQDEIAKEQSPRICNTHLVLASLPVKEMKEKKVKVLHVYRNPKDVAVSMYFHFSQLPWLENTTMREFVQNFLKGQVYFGDYLAYLEQMEMFIKENSGHPVLNVSYEETKRDPVGVVKRLADLLQVNATQQLCEEIAEACSFQKMKEIDATSKSPPPKFPPQLMFRKGEVGDWKNYLTVAESEMFDRYVADRLKDCSLFNFEYEA